MRKGLNILLGITGSIAAYKAAFLVRLLVKKGCNVKVVVTPAAKEFITPLTLATLAKNPVLCDFFEEKAGDWNSHVELGLWADLFIVAPATVNTMAKMANGVADNLLLTTYFSMRCPVMIAPAMDFDMYLHPANQKNITILKSYGNLFIEPAQGELASGLSGKGRMEEPEKIVEIIEEFFQKNQQLAGKTCLVTAGPTYEAIDSVRFIGNFSSGKMGYAIAEELANQGAKVILVSGPSQQTLEHPQIEIIKVKAAEEMYQASILHFSKADIAVLSAAVADFTPKIQYNQKLKREKENLIIELVPTKDIAAELGKQKRENQIMVGFALETNNERENALRKLQVKNLDFIVLNSLQEEGAGFNVDTNKINILEKNGNETNYPLKTKKQVAKDIVEKINEYVNLKK